MKTIALILLLVASQSLEAATLNVKENKTQNGRFQLIMLGDFRRDQYLLDTSTGILRRISCVNVDEKGDCTESVLSKILTEEQWIEKEIQLEKQKKQEGKK